MTASFPAEFMGPRPEARCPRRLVDLDQDARDQGQGPLGRILQTEEERDVTLLIRCQQCGGGRRIIRKKIGGE